MEVNTPNGFRVVVECVNALLGLEVPDLNGAIATTSSKHFATEKLMKKN